MAETENISEAIKYNTKLIYDAIKSSGQVVYNTLDPLVQSTATLADNVVSNLTQIMDNLTTGPGDPYFDRLNELVKRIDRTYYGQGVFADSFSINNGNPSVKALLDKSNNLKSLNPEFQKEIPSLATHVENMVKDFPKILSAVEQKQTFAKKILDQAGSDCNEYLNFFGTLLGQAEVFVNEVTTIFNQILDQISQLATATIDVITNALEPFISLLDQSIGWIVDVIERELNALADLFNELVDQMVASVLAVTDNPCIDLAIQILGAPDVLDAFNKRKPIGQ